MNHWKDNITRNQSLFYPWSAHKEIIYYNVLGVIYGLLCVIGLSGNTINAVVLGRCGLRRLFRQDRSAHVGFIFLALADAFVCLVCFPRVFIPDDANDFDSAGFELFYTLYGAHIAHTFMVMSTWMTVQLAIGRCIIVTDPFKNGAGRHVTGAKTFIICLMISLVAFVACLPTYWTLKINQVQIESDKSIFFVDQGYLGDNKSMVIMGWVRFVFGYVLPFIILSTCNIYLALHLSKSDRDRRRLTERSTRTNIGSKITPTLMFIIIVYLLLMTPSEILEFIFDGLGSLDNKTNIYILAGSFTNILQVTNYAINFALHIGINRGYRLALSNICKGLICVRHDESLNRSGFHTESRNTIRMSRINSVSPSHKECDNDTEQNVNISDDSTPRMRTRLHLEYCDCD